MTLFGLGHIFSHEIFATASISLLVIDLFKLFHLGLILAYHVYLKFQPFLFSLMEYIYIFKVHNHDFLKISLVSVVMSPLPSLILLIWAFSLLLSVHLTKHLVILFIFSKTGTLFHYLFALFCWFVSVSLISVLILLISSHPLCLGCVYLRP